MSRLIDADALNARLDFCTTKGMGSTIAFTFKHMVDEQPTITPEPHWIPVTKQPPEIGKSVLICDADGDICLGHRTNYGGYFPDFCEDKIKNVRAWAELPEPYREVTE